MATQPTPTKKSRKARNKRQVNHGRAYIFASFNNTIIMISDLEGNTLTISSSGACGFSGGKKGTSYAAGIAADKVANTAINNFGIKKLDIYVRGVGQGRDSSIRTLINKGLVIEMIVDQTRVPHGGVRPRKARRV